MLPRFHHRGLGKGIASAGGDFVPSTKPQVKMAWCWQRLLETGVYSSVTKLFRSLGC
jgi:hypothetical protein